jgi:hypothetical protein
MVCVRHAHRNEADAARARAAASRLFTQLLARSWRSFCHCGIMQATEVNHAHSMAGTCNGLKNTAAVTQHVVDITHPMTAASAHMSCAVSALSTSAVPTRCPLTLITSSTRPVIQ